MDEPDSVEGLRALPLSERRRLAGFSLLQGEDFLNVAERHGISPRTLLAWRSHEYGKWENDPYEGIEPGPGDDYDGEWPDRLQEMDEYARLQLDPSRFEDPGFREDYGRHLRKWNAERTAWRR